MAKKKKNSGIASLVSYSKKKNRKKDTPEIPWIAVAVCLLVIGIAGGSIYLIFNYRPTNATYQFAGSGAGVLSAADQAALLDTIESSPDGLNNALVSQIQRQTNAADVTVLLTGFNSYTVQIESRKPLFHIEADKRRYLSESGKIYGTALKTEKDNVLVAGLLSKDRKSFDFGSDHTLQLVEGEQDKINLLMKLWKTLSFSDLKTKKIKYIPFRGFELYLKDPETKVVLGKGDFESKVQRLKPIMSKLKETGKQAELIELDYKGKAFIREREI